MLSVGDWLFLWPRRRVIGTDWLALADGDGYGTGAVRFSVGLDQPADSGLYIDGLVREGAWREIGDVGRGSGQPGMQTGCKQGCALQGSRVAVWVDMAAVSLVLQ